MCKECVKKKYPSKYIKKPTGYFDERREARKKEKDHLREKLMQERRMIKEANRPIVEAANKARKKAERREYRKRRRSVPYARRVEKVNIRCAGLGKLSKDIVKILLTSQNCKCVYCQIDISVDRHIDHIVPIALGGLNVDSNVQLVCPPCNMKKADLPPWLFSIPVIP
jgi:5-methylcytosine-specific restriction endonuclease McrA